MIQLNPDALVFKTTQGDLIPCSAERVTIELIGDSAKDLDPEVIRHAAAAVLHYFKEELHKDLVSVAEFSQALEKVLSGLGLVVGQESPDTPPPAPLVYEADLCRIASSSGKGCELFFFNNLRAEFRRQEAMTGRIIRFSGLRRCVKQLVGAQKWSRRCQTLSDEIVVFSRSCFQTAGAADDRALIIT
jgi:hypothetical protein